MALRTTRGFTATITPPTMRLVAERVDKWASACMDAWMSGGQASSGWLSIVRQWLAEHRAAVVG
eukprot:184959-Chlamydomonas_euryale.AAC.1